MHAHLGGAARVRRRPARESRGRDGDRRTARVPDVHAEERGRPARLEHRVEADCAADAITDATGQIPGAAGLHNIWAIPCSEIASTDDDDLIWRYTDQTYRLARGYSKDVREKWEHLRARKDIDEYEKDDLKETF